MDQQANSPERTIDHFVPDPFGQCVVCGNSPCVKGFDIFGVLVYQSKMCGPCTFGSSDCINEENW